MKNLLLLLSVDIDCLRVRSYHYLELLVTSPGARGRGVATEIVREIQSKDRADR